jgi:hypothetical protein
MVLVMSITLGILTINVWDLPNMLPSGKRLHNYGKYPFFMGKSTISMAIFMMSFRAFSVRNISSHLFFQHDLGDQALCEAMFGLFGGAVFLISPGSL